MEIILIIVIPAILTWAVLSALPSGWVFLVGLLIASSLWWGAVDFGPPRPGADGLSHAAQDVINWGVPIAGGLITASQFWRWHRKKAGLPTYYGYLVAISGAVVFLISLSAVGS